MNKRTSIYVIMSILMIVTSFSCNKENDTINPLSSTGGTKKKRHASGVSVSGTGIPIYANFTVFRNLYVQIGAELNDSLSAVYSGYADGFSDYELDSTDVPNQLFERAISPLTNFGVTNGFNSLWNKVHTLNEDWMRRGDLDIYSYPDNDYAMDDVMKSMLNENGDMIVDNKIYHFISEKVHNLHTPNNVTELGVLEIPVDSIEFLDSLNLNPEINNINLLKLNQWPLPDQKGNYHSAFPFDSWNSTCSSNRANWGSEDYQNNKKYYWKNGFNFDLLGTHAFTNMEVWHKSKILGWIHDIQTLQVPMQLKTLDKNCANETDQFSSPSLWSPYLQNNANFWATYRNILKGFLDANHNVTSKNYYKKHVLTWQ